MKSKKIVIGKIIATHGVKGLFKLNIYTKSEKDFFFYKKYFMIKNNHTEIKKEFSKGSSIVCSSNNIKNKDQAIILVGEEVWIHEKEIKNKKLKEYYHKDLINCTIYDEMKKSLGKIKAIHNFGAGDVLELDGKYQYMIRLADIDDDYVDIRKKAIIYKKKYYL
ncbi:MAG: 16S rRNA processing protein RimM [Rickettsiales bacterium]|nr:16S rRNA processing protein RimM [Rickettsiales bacterium]|tara:strand:- start:699 stop:1190 length:492 start_codon:yes stop_codon:yes gene_type:complete